MRDHGFPATIIPGGINFSRIPEDQNQKAQAVQAACEAGMNTPSPRPRNEAELGEIYEYMLALRECLIAEGYDIPEPPSKQVWIDTHYDPDLAWKIWSFVPDAGNPEYSWEHIEVRCPAQPVGGYGQWEPGDPVVPMQEPPNAEPPEAEGR
ncbi:MAG: hypothetical protein R3343_06800 [Nitriliruptorales bacterium]|nr:hypothetical protein [Nitriliruptorales bacterium]